MKYHPDRANKYLKGMYEETFKEITFAYSILGDTLKRQRYDKYGVTDNTIIIEEQEEVLRGFNKDYTKLDEVRQDNFCKALNREGAEELCEKCDCMIEAEGDGVCLNCGHISPPPVIFDNEVNIHHNFAKMENHFGQNVIIHRKGATSAYEGQYGIIPGSQGTPSYIVKGRGNIESFKSCSHGAGRKMSRSKAKVELNLEDEIKKLDEQGIIHSIKDIGNLDEASGAYKDIENVMDEQKDLVDIMVKLQPLAVVKG